MMKNHINYIVKLSYKFVNRYKKFNKEDAT